MVMNTLKDDFTVEYNYPGNPDRGQYKFRKYLAFSCDVMIQDRSLPKEEALHWIKADLDFHDALISSYADTAAAVESEPEEAVTRSLNQNRSDEVIDEICRVFFCKSGRSPCPQ